MILAVSKRWHLWRFHAAAWLLSRVVTPLGTWLTVAARESGKLASELHSKAKLREEICMRCPSMQFGGLGCAHCPCFMPAKRQVADATCAHPTNKRW